MSVENLQKIISKKFTATVIDKIISKKCELNDTVIERIEIGGESKKGDSYLSTICRFKIYVTGKAKNGGDESVVIPVITKFLLTNIGRRKTFRSVDFFENEAIFYEKVWPAIQQFEKSKNLQETFTNIPLCFYTVIDGENDFIALEDVSFYGYGNMERSNGLDYQKTTNILKLLAHFHGLCLAFKDQQYQNFDTIAKQLKETYFHERYRQWYEKFQRNVIKIGRDAVEKELTGDYLNKFDKFVDGDFFGKICQLSDFKQHKLSTITHGDTWLPNFLFKSPKDGDNQPSKIVMIDFQLTRYTILTNDLTFFLFTCVDMGVIEHRWDDLIAEYHAELVKNLEKFGTNPELVSLNELHEAIKESIPFGVGMSLEALTMSMLDDDQVSDLDLIQGNEAVPLETVWLVSPFQEQEKRKRLARMIKFTIDKDFI